MKGVIDRIEEGVAVVVIPEKNEQFTLAENDLPQGCKAGVWLTLTYDDGTYTIVGVDKQTTLEQEKKISDLHAQLQKRKKTSKFKRRTRKDE